MTDLRAKLTAALACPDEHDDPDEVNATFHSPFTGMKEMYALQKGIEHGQRAENMRLRPVLGALVGVVDAAMNVRASRYPERAGTIELEHALAALSAACEREGV